MNEIKPDMLLSTLVTGAPRLAPTLERLGLDYCCGGARTLADACAIEGLDVDNVVTTLAEQAPGEPEEWASMTPPELIDHLKRTHHAYLGEVLPHLSGLAERVLAVHGANHPELADVSATYGELRADLEPHLMKEEQVLFPMVREMYSSDGLPAFHCGSLQNPIRVMDMEHDRAGELLARLRSLTSVYTPPSDACASYQALYSGLAELEADTHLHIHKENNILFPTVVAEELERSRSAPAG